MSICFFNQKNYTRAKETATASLDIKKSIKAYGWRAKARAYLNEFEDACEDIRLALKLDTSDPNNLQAELTKYEKYAKAARKTEND